MEKVFKIFDSHEQADVQDFEYYSSLSPDQRVQLLLELISNYGNTYYNGSTERLERIHRIIDREEC